MPQDSDQDKITKVMLRVCTGKKDQKVATKVARDMTDDQAAIAMTFFAKYGTPEFILVSEAIKRQIDAASFGPLSLSVLAATVPVLTSFGVESELARSYLQSIVGAAQKHVEKDDFEYLSRGMVVGFLSDNIEPMEHDHLIWLGQNAESLGKHVIFLQQHRSASRHICNLALSGLASTAPSPLSAGVL